jgi:hypothetical protein
MNSIGLRRNNVKYRTADKMLLERLEDGLVSIIFSIRKYPMIRYLKDSRACRDLAEGVSDRISQQI